MRRATGPTRISRIPLSISPRCARGSVQEARRCNDHATRVCRLLQLICRSFASRPVVSLAVDVTSRQSGRRRLHATPPMLGQNWPGSCPCFRRTASRSIAPGRPRFGVWSPTDQLWCICSSLDDGPRKLGLIGESAKLSSVLRSYCSLPKVVA